MVRDLRYQKSEGGVEIMFCAKCGVPNTQDNNFCVNCGSRLSQNVNISDNQIQPPKKLNDEWYKKPIVIVLFLIFCFPIGIPLMWKYSKWDKWVKGVVSIFCVAIFIVSLGENPEQVKNTTSSTASEVKETNYATEKTLEEQKQDLKESFDELKEAVNEIKDDEEVRKSYNNMKESVKKSVDTIIAIENKETGTTTEAILTEEEYKGLCEKFEYKDIARNPKEYENKNVIVTGKVIQVSEGWFNTVRLRVATKGYTDDVYLITYKQVESNRILEEDRVTIWGKCTGVTTYTSVLGDNITVPSVEMKYYEIHQ